jgi:hypothetical protein
MNNVLVLLAAAAAAAAALYMGVSAAVVSM